MCIADGECLVYVRPARLPATDEARMDDISSAAFLLFEECIKGARLQGGEATRVGK